ncbi:alkaline phosphatase (plasmid) [Halostagnicola larsenii XH-48]|uniref:Alkaline phosphatase n=1 Tax=Halostagnicola larsenii XH-48 TaxID=797299 RepID=W0JTS0_9EURY|nr:alkaline phosphatase D family protein [Halostagnicola larsenii]AHG01979.1 alkaline phosphatase [Halostagnicola larsenii XH-48]
MLSTVGIAGTTVATLDNATPGRATDKSVGERDTHSEVEDLDPVLAQLGDLDGDRAIIWGRANCPSRLYVEIATDETFSDVRTVRGPAALSVTDYTARVDLKGLPRGEQVFYRVVFDRLNKPGSYTDAVSGSFRTPPAQSEQAGDLRFLWGGDVAGQGWGIDPEHGGMKIFETMADLDPDFFIHSGDAVYADGPLQKTVEFDNGENWTNIVTEAKRDVADTLAEFRGNYLYNFLDEHYREFVAEVPVIAQWDDHEVTNNWYPGEILSEEPHDVKSVDLLAARGQRAFLEYMPVRSDSHHATRDEHYDTFDYGPLVDVFRLDLRSYRGPNIATLDEERSSETAILGEKQLAWLKESIADSDATWKVIASDMPIGLLIPDGDVFEGIGNADGAPRGREFEIAELLSFLHDEGIYNVVWFTADVHYTAAHHYHPDRAQFSEFNPFWEFVSGPLHAGTFGPNKLDNTFGPKVIYEKSPPEGEANLPPSAGLQFFGQVDIDADTEALTVTLKNRDGESLYSTGFEQDQYGR